MDTQLQAGPTQVRVKGVSFCDRYPDNLRELDLIAGLSAKGPESLQAQLVRASDNPFDTNAIEVHVSPVGNIGFVPGEMAASLAPLIDEGQLFECEVWVRIDKRRPDRPGAEVRLTPIN